MMQESTLQVPNSHMTIAPQLGMHLIAPGNDQALRDNDHATSTCFSRSDMNLVEPSRRHSSSEESSRITNNISNYRGFKSRSSMQSKKELYNTAEPQQRSSDGM